MLSEVAGLVASILVIISICGTALWKALGWARKYRQNAQSTATSLVSTLKGGLRQAITDLRALPWYQLFGIFIMVPVAFAAMVWLFLVGFLDMPLPLVLLWLTVSGIWLFGFVTDTMTTNARVNRMQAALERMQSALQNVTPQKTLVELRQEERDYETEMQSVFHHSTALYFNLGPRPPTTCGYDGSSYYSTQDWSVLLQMERERMALESAGGKSRGRQACQRCLALAPR